MRSLLSILLLLILSACGTPTSTTPEGSGAGGDVALPDGAATIIGQITWLDNGSMLIEENPGQAGTGRKIVFQLQADTVVAERTGDAILARAQTDLQVGQRVAAWADGALAESYPEQGSAAAVVISLPAPSP